MLRISRALTMVVAVGSMVSLAALSAPAGAAPSQTAATVIYSGTATIGTTGTLNLSTGQVNAPDSSWNLWWENDGGGSVANALSLVATHGRLHNKVSTPYATLKRGGLAALTYKAKSIKGGPAPVPNRLLAGDVVGVKLPSAQYAKVKVIWNRHLNGIRISWTLYS